MVNFLRLNLPANRPSEFRDHAIIYLNYINRKQVNYEVMMSRLRFAHVDFSHLHHPNRVKVDSFKTIISGNGCENSY